MLRFVLLALLVDGRPAHGYALMKAFAARSGVRVSIGNVYRELQRLAAMGLIVPADNPAGADPRRAPWAITERGRAALATWCAMPAERFVRPVPDALAYRVALLADADGHEATTALDELAAELAQAARAVARAQAGPPAAARDGALPTRAALLRRRSRYLEADLALVAELREALGRGGAG